MSCTGAINSAYGCEASRSITRDITRPSALSALVEEEEVEEEVEIISEYKITYASVCAAVNKVSVVPSPLVPSPLVKACSTSSGIKPMLVNGQRAWADYSSDEDEDEE